MKFEKIVNLVLQVLGAALLLEGVALLASPEEPARWFGFSDRDSVVISELFSASILFVFWIGSALALLLRGRINSIVAMAVSAMCFCSWIFSIAPDFFQALARGGNIDFRLSTAVILLTSSLVGCLVAVFFVDLRRRVA